MANTTRNASVVSLAVTVLTLTAVVYYSQKNQKPEYKDVCKTTDCFDQAAIILKSMNKSVDPCQDFYQYACGGWEINNPIPDTRGDQHVMNIINEENQEILKRALGSVDPNDRDAIKKAKMYYQACVDEETLTAKGPGPAYDVMKELGGFPLFGTRIKAEDFDLAKYLSDALVYDTPILNFYVYLDPKDATNHLLFIEQPKLIMPSIQLYLLDQFAPIQEGLRNYIRDLIALMWKNLEKEGEVIPFDEEALEQAVDDVHALEKDLATILIPQENLFDIPRVFKNLTQGDLEDLTPDFDWRTYISTILGKADLEATDDTLIGTRTVPYLQNMTSVLMKHSVETIQNYVVIFNIIGNTVNMAKQYRGTGSSFNQIFTGVTAEEERWKVCLSVVTTMFPMAVGAVYVDSAFTEESRDQVLDITDHIFEAFMQEVDALDWMDEQTKEEAKLKASLMNRMMAYPEYIVNETDPKLDDEYKYAEVEEGELFKASYSAHYNIRIKGLKNFQTPVDKNEWFMSPAAVNAYYEPLRNAFAFPAGILQSPIFDSTKPYAFNFGGIGEIVAHEMSHGFDQSGSFFDGDGNLRDWWSADSRMSYNARLQCFVEQYGKYFYKKAEQYINGELTLDENVADSGGIKFAYEGYQVWKKNNGQKEFTLPGLEDLTHNQMVFIGFAQAFCESDTKQNAILRLSRDTHSPAVFRIIGALHNFDKFGETFECEMGEDYMYRRPNETCVLW